MLPGYTLRAMTDIGYSHAMAAFNAVALSLSTSGNLGEVLVFDDHSGLTIIYDQGGAVGDYTAKFRPWEGGIVLDAVLKYLIGFMPDAPHGVFRIRPHLPNSWPFARYTGLRMGNARFDLDLHRTDTGGHQIGVPRRAGG